VSVAPSRLRVAVAAAEPETAAHLAGLAAASGHAIVDTGDRADVILTDGSAEPNATLPVVAVGAAGPFAGLLPEDAGPAQIDAALRAVALGLVVRLPPLPLQGFAALPAPCAPLTPREIEVLKALAAGLNNKAAARRLGISPHTVKFHIESLFRKLGAATRAEAVAKGLTHQIVEL
jgi:DNA-binding NarL/FixJ family response regulator